MVFLFSCEKDADIKLPKVEPVLSVYGFLSPEDTITNIVVKNSRPFFGEKVNSTIDYVTDARVEITIHGQDYVLPYSEQTNSYYLDSNVLKIIPGEEYFIEVAAPDFPTVTSSTVILESNNETLELVKTTKPTDSGEYYFFNVRWTDNPNEKNYYRLTGYVYENSQVESLDRNNIFLYDDSDWSGHTITSNDLIYIGAGTELHLILLNIDYNYYQYHKTVRDFVLYGDLPFSEPVFVNSNIKNGVGVFASFRKYEIIKTL